MVEDVLTALGGRTRFDQVFQGLRARLLEVLPARPEEVSPTQRHDQLIPRLDRRRVWQELREAGFALPPLRLPSQVFLAAAFVVLAPVAILVLLLNWSFVFALVELSIWARRVTRPLAIELPLQTVQEAVLYLTPIRRADYHAGLWPPEAIALKVRALIAEAAGRPLESVQAETRISDLG
jgi:hypothetical protein